MSRIENLEIDTNTNRNLTYYGNSGIPIQQDRFFNSWDTQLAVLQRK